MKVTMTDIPIRNVLGEPPTRAIRRWQIDSDPYEIGTALPTITASEIALLVHAAVPSVEARDADG